MKVINPLTITSGMVTSTTATNVDADYVPATAYALNNRCTYNNVIYQCIQGPATGQQPNISPLYWVAQGPSNKWAMFDDQISTLTTASLSLTTVLEPGICNAIAFQGLLGTTLELTLQDGSGGSTIYSKTVSLDGSIISDWYQYFYEAAVQLAEVALTDIPPCTNAYMTTVITGGGTVAVGVVTVGTQYVLGDTQAGANVSIIDYSVKQTDAFGVTSFVRRAYSKRMSASLVLSNAQINKVQRVLAELRAKPAVWIGSEAPNFQPLIIFGFYRDFTIDIAYAHTSYCSLEIEGLT
jgi:hypothetical protein